MIAVYDYQRLLQLTRMNEKLKELNESLNLFARNIQVQIAPMMSVINAAMTSSISPSFLEDMRKLSDSLKEAEKNPDSLYNQFAYRKALDGYHWTWPYEMSATQLKKTIDNTTDEKAFDQRMSRYYSGKRVKKLGDDIGRKLNRKDGYLIDQILSAFVRKHFAIANNTILSILDYQLSHLMKNKGNVRRYGLIQPIVKDYGYLPFRDIPFIFRMDMLSHCLDFIFEDVSFSEKVTIRSNKKAKRHPMIHGFRYSNQRIDFILLLSALYELLSLQCFLEPYFGTMIIDKKTKTCLIDETKRAAITRNRKKIGL